ncbi:MAG TPA: hypothetical protein VF043_11970 [Ktedonobacteraceae bacterium]
MWNEIAAWQEQLHLHPDLSAKTIALYTQDTRRLATWLQRGGRAISFSKQGKALLRK